MSLIGSRQLPPSVRRITMAKKASAEAVAADMRPPNFRSAVQIIRGAILKKKAAIQGINSEIGDQWAKVEGYKVNKKAGQIFATLDKLEQEERMDIMRSLNGLMDAAGWDDENADMVDRAEGNVVAMRFGKSDDGASQASEAGNGEDPEIAALCDQIDADGHAAKSDVAAAADAKKQQLDAAAKAPVNEPYTGDNADLVGEEEALAAE
jgi:hypothetical protein